MGDLLKSGSVDSGKEKSKGLSLSLDNILGDERLPYFSL